MNLIYAQYAPSYFVKTPGSESQDFPMTLYSEQGIPLNWHSLLTMRADLEAIIVDRVMGNVNWQFVQCAEEESKTSLT